MPDDGKPKRRAWSAVRREADGCRRCDLWRNATQTVFGEGNTREGRPFVGPAGRLLREALAEAGIVDSDVYVTNAVKHFKWTERGKRRIHEKPNRVEVAACRLWLEEEIALVQPEVVVALGATAAADLLGPSVRVTKDRGKQFSSSLAPIVTVTVHPSSILRADDATRATARREFVNDLRAIGRMRANRST